MNNLLNTLESIEEIAKYGLVQNISLNEISKKFFHKPKYAPSLETM